MNHELPDPEEFVSWYGDEALVKIGDRTMTLGQALAAESLFCPADAATRQEPEQRLGYLASMLAAAGTLDPQDSYLLSERQE